MVTHLGDDPAEASQGAHDTKYAHARFSFLKKFYKDHLQKVMDAEGDNMQIEYHQTCALKCYLLFLVGMSMFLDKSEIYVDVVYLQYFIDLTAIHEYN